MNTSERITLLRFPLIVGVVFIHAYGSVQLADGTAGTATIPFGVQFVQELLSQTVARVAVPLFYAMSGFLFFLTFDGTRQVYAGKLRSRMHSLLAPYLIWNTLVILALALAQALPATRDYFSGKNTPIAELDLLGYLNAYLGHGVRQHPIAYQFWFIRDLMLLTVLAPLVSILVRKAARVALMASAIVWLVTGYDHSMLLDPGACLFFIAGAYLARQQHVLDGVDRFGPKLIFLYIVLAPIDALLTTGTMGMLAHKVGIVAGLGATWYVAGLLRHGDTLTAWLVRLSTLAFFVFAAHEPLLTTLKKLSYRLADPQHGFGVLLIYLLSPILAILVTLCVGACLRRIAPRLFSILCGGR